jgi:hypothetical protein
MTIAIGYHCYRGVMVMADTAVVVSSEGEIQEGSKLDIVSSYSGKNVFAFVNSSGDGHATATLISDISRDLFMADLRIYLDFEQVMKARMTEWRKAFGGRKPPSTQLIAAARLGSSQAKLYFCEPPNTVREMDNYVSAGIGASVADPLHALLFSHDGGEYAEVQTALKRMAYLTYHAKEGNAYCGKDTLCAVIPDAASAPIEVAKADMKTAESIMKGLDFLLSSAAIFATGSDPSNVDHHAGDLGDILISTDALRLFKFHDHYGDEIRL